MLCFLQAPRLPYSNPGAPFPEMSMLQRFFARASALFSQRLGWCYGCTVLVSAMLAFQVQLLVSKSILPWFGGAPAVWTTCMLFFQVTLCGGYAYAHWSVARWRPARQGLVHLGLIFLAIALLPVTPAPSWKPVDADYPVFRILLLLTACAGFPFFVLSATGPLLQAWFAQTHQDRSPYRLYALSNIGSLLGLVSYPFLVEPELSLTRQTACWSLGFTIFAMFCGYCALKAWKREDRSATGKCLYKVTPPLQERVAAEPPGEGTAGLWSDFNSTDATECGRVEHNVAGASDRPTVQRWLAWLALAALGSVMLLATTNHVCQDVAVIPFLWVLPLTVYLLTFIICFEKESWYSRRWCGGGAAICLASTAVLLQIGNGQNLLLEMTLCLATLFLVCMVCHGELIRLKPSPRHLTSFYLMSSAGGAAGGVLVAIVAPLVFRTHVEFTLGMLVSYLLAVAVVAQHYRSLGPLVHRRFAQGGLLLAFAGCLLVLRCQASGSGPASRVTARSFYGVLHVDEVDCDDPDRHGLVLRYGRILHGYQRLSPELRREPTLYYDRHSGVGLAIEHHPQRQRGLRIGAVGLGVGTIAGYGRAADHFRFYEINPDVVQAARQEFSYLGDCPCPTDVVLGDARLSLEREPPQGFDVLALDAFSGDAIPTHLLTREAFEIYLQHLAPGGALAVHITNRHVDLAPILQSLAEHFGLQLARIDTQTRLDAGVTASSWAVLTQNCDLLQQPEIRAAIAPHRKEYAHIPLWTDDYSNIFQILR